MKIPRSLQPYLKSPLPFLDAIYPLTATSFLHLIAFLASISTFCYAFYNTQQYLLLFHIYHHSHSIFLPSTELLSNVQTYFISSTIGASIGAMCAFTGGDLLGRKTSFLYALLVLFMLFILQIQVYEDVNQVVFSNKYLYITVLVEAMLAWLVVHSLLYISEIAPTEQRGQLLLYLPLNLFCGSLFSFVIHTNSLGNITFVKNQSPMDFWSPMNLHSTSAGEDSTATTSSTASLLALLHKQELPNHWRYSLVILLFCILLVFYIFLFVPESPRWLLAKKTPTDCAHALQELRNPQFSSTSTTHSSHSYTSTHPPQPQPQIGGGSNPSRDKVSIINEEFSMMYRALSSDARLPDGFIDLLLPTCVGVHHGGALTSWFFSSHPSMLNVSSPSHSTMASSSSSAFPSAHLPSYNTSHAYLLNGGQHTMSLRLYLGMLMIVMNLLFVPILWSVHGVYYLVSILLHFSSPTQSSPHGSNDSSKYPHSHHHVEYIFYGSVYVLLVIAMLACYSQLQEIDRVDGRRKAMLYPTVFIGLSMLVVSFVLFMLYRIQYEGIYNDVYSNDSIHWLTIVLLIALWIAICMWIFYATYSWISLLFIYMVEIFPYRARSKMLSLLFALYFVGETVSRWYFVQLLFVLYDSSTTNTTNPIQQVVVYFTQVYLYDNAWHLIQQISRICFVLGILCLTIVMLLAYLSFPETSLVFLEDMEEIFHTNRLSYCLSCIPFYNHNNSSEDIFSRLPTNSNGGNGWSTMNTSTSHAAGNGNQHDVQQHPHGYGSFAMAHHHYMEGNHNHLNNSTNHTISSNNSSSNNVTMKMYEAKMLHKYSHEMKESKFMFLSPTHTNNATSTTQDKEGDNEEESEERDGDVYSSRYQLIHAFNDSSSHHGIEDEDSDLLEDLDDGLIIKAFTSQYQSNNHTSRK